MTTPIILTVIILTVINTLLAWIVFYRLGRQSVINNLLKAYKEECRNSEAGMEIIYALKERIRQLKEKDENKEKGNKQ